MTSQEQPSPPAQSSVVLPPEGSAEPIRIRFEMTSDDYDIMSGAVSGNDQALIDAWTKPRKRFWTALPIAASLACAVFIFVGLNVLSTFSAEGRWIFAFALVGGVVWLWTSATQYVDVSLPWAHLEVAMLRSRIRSAEYNFGLNAMTIGPEGITVHAPHDDVVQRWSGIALVRQTPTHVSFVRLDRLALLIPRRVFSSPEQCSEVVKRSRAWLAAKGYGELVRVRDYLLSHDAPCPGCGYNLRAIPGDCCPECSRELDREVIPIEFEFAQLERTQNPPRA